METPFPLDAVLRVADKSISGQERAAAEEDADEETALEETIQSLRFKVCIC